MVFALLDFVSKEILNPAVDAAILKQLIYSDCCLS